MSLAVALQGQQGSFHDLAAQSLFGANFKRISCITFADTFKQLAVDHADKAVVAIENSLFGSINDVYDLLLKYKFWISDEVYLRIEQCLIGFPGAKYNKIKEVHSQAPALSQCEDFLNKNMPKAERIEQHDTAASVEFIKESNDPTKAAIGSSAAAKLHGLEVLAHEIEANKQNYTRFVILDKNRFVNKKANKTSLVLDTPHTPGTLYKALGVFAKHNMNLSKLQSRPIIGRAWHYMFYVDINQSAESPGFSQTMKELEAIGCKATVLGSYKTTSTISVSI